MGVSRVMCPDLPRLVSVFMLLFLASGVAESLNSTTENVGAQKSEAHIWPELEWGWRICVGTLVAFLGAAAGSACGIGGGGIFIPMLTLVIGFDAKSSTALSKCMIMGTSVAAFYYNLKLRHPTLDLPMVDYDLALLIQPMLVLGISIGVGLNVIFANWMITVLLIVLFILISVKSFLKGVRTWKKETSKIKKAEKKSDSTGTGGLEGGICNDGKPVVKEEKKTEVSVIENVRWKELGLLCSVWIVILSIQLVKSHTTNCSLLYWLLNLLQFPVAGAVSGYQAVALYKGQKALTANKEGNAGTKMTVRNLIVHCSAGIIGGMIGGLAGLGGGFVVGPILLELGIPPQVSSATATFLMIFSSSMSVVEYYILKRFPVPYASYLFGVATLSAWLGQHVIRKLIEERGRASLIIFLLALTIFLSAFFLGGAGLSKMAQQIRRHEYMGFGNMCKHCA